MANEITQNITLQVTKNGATASFPASKRVTMTGDDFTNQTQVIGTSAELVDFGDITGAPGNLAIKNLDATNYVEIGGDSGLTVFKLKINAGESCLITPTSATLYAKANTADVRILILAIEV